MVEMEWCFLSERSEVMVNVTGIYDEDLVNVLAQIEEAYTWTGATFETDSFEGEVTQWMYLLGATKRSDAWSDGNRSAGDTASRQAR